MSFRKCLGYILVTAAASFSFVGNANALTIATTGDTAGEAGGIPVNQSVYSVTVDDAGDIGSSFTMNWAFNGTDNVSAAGIFTILDYDGSATGFLNLGVEITNTSSVTVDSNPRILSYGFNTNPDVTALTVTDDSNTDVDIFVDSALDVTFPSFQTIDVCVFAQNCTGGAVNGGLASGQTDSMILSMTGDFSSSNTFYISDFAMKFQAINSYELPGQGECTQDCGPPPEGNVPAPATLALMGIGLLGFVATRRRRIA